MDARFKALYTEACKNLDLTDDILQKFAELIVRECASIVEGSPWNLPRGYKAVDQAELVKKHFGVE